MKIKLMVTSIALICSLSAFAADLPQNENSFINITSNAIEQASNAKNDMQKGGIKAKRDDALCAALKKKTVNNWIGKVTKVDSNGDGKGVLAVEIAENITLKTWNNALSDIGDKTLIDPRTKLFEKASMLAEGDQVKFSGQFFKGAEACIEESSMSLSGGLSDPEFIFRFSDIEKI